VQCTVSPYNIFQLPEFSAYFRKLGFPVLIQPVSQPEFLSPRVLPPELADKAAAKLSSTDLSPAIVTIRNSLDSSASHLWDQFLRYTHRLDEIRGQRMKAIVPELV
jgi:hypothetical protein